MPKFQPGRSGNPAGRPKGCKDRRTEYARGLLEPHAKALMQKVVDLALEGDTTALRLCLERLVPPLRDRPQPVTVAGLTGTLTEQGQAVLRALGSGALAPEEAARVLGALADQARIVEVDELERRVQALEQRGPTR
jgi:hypothetical protein